jgi:uncharacterized protein with HEPN domain
MLDAVVLALGFVQGRSREDMDTDPQLNMAILRALEVLGEASKHVSEECRERYPELPWRRMARTRDRLIHGYDNLDNDIVWETVTLELPDVLAALEKIVPREGK